jgi:hypothetical protein
MSQLLSICFDNSTYRTEEGEMGYFLVWKCDCGDAETSAELPFCDNLFLLANLTPGPEIVLSM